MYYHSSTLFFSGSYVRIRSEIRGSPRSLLTARPSLTSAVSREISLAPIVVSHRFVRIGVRP